MAKNDCLSTLFVGIDIGSRKNVISAIDFNQNYLIKMKSLPNAQYGAEEMESLILNSLTDSTTFKHVTIGLESTGYYGVHIANYLSSSEKLLPFGVKVYCLNPKEVANYKKSYNDLPKNDGIDSFIIADFARVGRIAVQPWKGPQYLALQRLTRHRLHLAECLSREKTYMLNNIYLKFSEFALLDKGNHPFSDKYGATAMAVLLEYKTLDDIINSSVDELIEFISQKGHGRFIEPDATAELLQKAARNSYRLDKTLYEPITTSISCSYNCIKAYEKEMTILDAAILKAVNGLNPLEYQILTSIPGIGKVYGAGILAEIGSVKCFPDNDSLAKYCGIIWKDNDSGNFTSEDRAMSKHGNTYLRYYIHEATGQVIRHVPEYKLFYDKKFAEVNKHQHKRALALTSRKLIRMLFGLLDKSRLYTPDGGR